LVRLAPYPNLRDECSGARQPCASMIHFGPVGWISLRIHQTRGSCSHLIVKKYPRRWMRLGLSALRNSSIEHLVVGWDGHVGVQRSLDSRVTPTYEMSVVVLGGYVPSRFILVPVGWISLRIHQTRSSCSHLIVKKIPTTVDALRLIHPTE